MGVPAVLLPSENLARSATWSITGASASVGFPLANLHDGDVTLPFIASASGAARLIADLGSAARVDDAFLPFYNIPAGTLVKFEGHTSNSWGAPDVSVTVTIPAYRSLGPLLDAVPESVRANVLAAYPTEASRTKRWWSWSIAAFADPLAIGETLFGPLTELWGFSPDANADDEELPAVVKETAFGNRWSFRYPLLNRRQSGMLTLTGTERDLFKTLEREIGGTADPFIWVPDIEDSSIGMLVTLEQAIQGTQLASEAEGFFGSPSVGADAVHRIQMAFREVPKGLPL